MKHCPYCGKEYPDEVDVCPTDNQRLQPIGEQAGSKIASALPTPPRDEISPEEQRFWERMTFRQLAILIVRIQAVWMIYNGVIEITYLSRYIDLFIRSSVYARPIMSPYETRELIMLVLRIFIHFAVAIFLIQKAEKVLSWFVRDYVEESSAKIRAPENSRVPSRSV